MILGCVRGAIVCLPGLVSGTRDFLGRQSDLSFGIGFGIGFFGGFGWGWGHWGTTGTAGETFRPSRLHLALGRDFGHDAVPSWLFSATVTPGHGGFRTDGGGFHGSSGFHGVLITERPGFHGGSGVHGQSGEPHSGAFSGIYHGEVPRLFLPAGSSFGGAACIAGGFHAEAATGGGGRSLVPLLIEPYPVLGNLSRFKMEKKHHAAENFDVVEK